MDNSPTQSPAEPPVVPRPSVGRIVHFRRRFMPAATLAEHEHPAAAVVTNVYTEGGLMVELYVMPCSWDGTPRYETSINHESEASAGGSFWSWPPRVGGGAS